MSASENTKVQWVLDEVVDTLKGLRFLLAATLTPILVMLSKVEFEASSLPLSIKILISASLAFFAFASIVLGFAIVKTMLVSTEIRIARRGLKGNDDLRFDEVEPIVQRHWGGKKRPWLAKAARWSALLGYSLVLILFVVIFWC